MHRVSWLSTAVIALVLAACASSPPTLVALPAATTPGARQAPDAAVTVRLRQVRVADYLDGFAVVIGRDSNVLVVADRTEWAERALGLIASIERTESAAIYIPRLRPGFGQIVDIGLPAGDARFVRKSVTLNA